MSCKIVFTFNGQKETLELDNLDLAPNDFLTQEELLKVLKDNPKFFNNLTSRLRNNLEILTSLTPVTFKTIKNKAEGITPNCTLAYLRERFPLADLPEGIEANILLLGSLRVGNKMISGRIINSQGKEIFVVSPGNNGAEINHLANYLRVRLSIIEESLNYSEDTDEYKKLTELCEVTKKPSISELLIDFNDNLLKYSDIKFKNGKQALTFLVSTLRTILQYNTLGNYSDEFVLMVETRKKFNFKTKNYSVEKIKLLSDLMIHKPKVLEEFGLMSPETLIKFMSDKDYAKLLLVLKFPEIETDGLNPYAVFFKYLLLVEPDFPLVYYHHDKDYVYFKKTAKSLHYKHGITYDTISTFDIINDDYKGYMIYAHYNEAKKKTEYYISRGTLVELNTHGLFDSEDSAKAEIDSIIERLFIRNNSGIEFKFREKYLNENDEVTWTDELESFKITSKTYYKEGQIIRSIDIPISSKTSILLSELHLLLDKTTIKDFLNVVNSWNFSDVIKSRIIKEMDTPEKIAIFIYKINEKMLFNRDNDEQVSEILDLFESPEIREYYVESVVNGFGNQYTYRLIPTTSIEIGEYRKNKRFPVIYLLNSIAKVMEEKMGVPVKLLTANEINELFKDINVSTSKAFIRDGVIYVNTSIASSDDLVHEYTHLFLGILKADLNLRQNYERLMYLVGSTTQGKAMFDELKNTYTSASTVDLLEETFCNLFSEYIMKTTSLDDLQLFKECKSNLKSAAVSIFGTLISDIETLFKGSIDSIFTRFSRDVHDLLAGSQIDFSVTSKSRMYSNFISKKIEEGEIILNCNGL